MIDSITKKILVKLISLIEKYLPLNDFDVKSYQLLNPFQRNMKNAGQFFRDDLLKFAS